MRSTDLHFGARVMTTIRSVIDAPVTGQIDPSPLVTRKVPLDQVDGSFEALMGSAVDSKIFVDPRARP
jgi:threonine dehydrogenase-like Zn-dependent dehydrogenase